MSESPEQQPTLPIEARAAKDPAVRMFIGAGMLLAFGIWFYIDGHVKAKYPYKPFAEDLNAWFKWALNYWGPFLFIPAAIVVLAWAIRFLRRRLVVDSQGIGYLGKEKIAWGQISRVDASALQSKGLLCLYCGDEKKLTLDSWKLERFRDIVAAVEANVPPDRISR